MDNIRVNDNGIIEIDNIENYTYQIKNNKIILYPKDEYLTYEELLISNIIKTKIIKCNITNKYFECISSNKNKYATVLLDIWKTIPIEKIRDNTTFKIKLTNENTKGYRWSKELKYSFQSKDAKGTLKEIIHMCDVNCYNIEIKIQLENGNIINFKKLN
jgi:hypothetical protein